METTNTTPPTCWIIAGPNGAGKTTFALDFLPELAGSDTFINADLIAAGLAPLAPESALVAASRLFLREIERCVKARKTFAFETTLSGRSYLKKIRQLRSDGWRTELIYLALPDVAMSRMRVAERVLHGGHDIPLEDIERRFPKSLQNLLGDFSTAVDRTQCFMNDGPMPQPVFVQESEQRTILDPKQFERLTKGAQL